MKKALLFFVFLFLALQFSLAQGFDRIVLEYAKEPGAESLELLGKELSAMRFMMPEHKKAFLKLVDRMTVLIIKKCVPSVRERFYKELSVILPEGYFVEDYLDDNDVKNRVFVKLDKKKGVCTEVVIAAMDDNNEMALTILKGKFTLEEMKMMFE